MLHFDPEQELFYLEQALRAAFAAGEIAANTKMLLRRPSWKDNKLLARTPKTFEEWLASREIDT